jgi:hypothetical protein
VAGKGAAPQQVQLVDQITLNGQRLLDESLDPADSPNADVFVRETNEDGSPTFRFNPDYYATANFVGATANIGRDQTFVFQFVDSDNDGVYDLGEVPIDGLIVAKQFNQANVTFTPNAKLVAGVFSDYDNKN